MTAMEQIQTALQFFRAGLLNEAKNACKPVLDNNPKDPAARRLMGQIAYLEGDPDQALEHIKASLAEKPDQFSLQVKLGNVLADLRRPEEALEAYDKAIELDPEHHLGYFWKGQALAARGDMEGAFRMYETALKKNDEYGPAYRLIVKTGNPWVKSKVFRENLELKSANKAVPREDRIHMHYALAEIYGQLGKNDLMMARLKLANGLQKNQAGEWRPSHNALLEKMRNLFSDGKILKRAARKKTKPVPVLIVSLPRAGSTLLEAMLGCHSKITTGGETRAAPSALLRIQTEHTKRDFPEGIEELTENAWQGLSTTFMEKLRGLSGNKSFVTDKLLPNGHILGLIYLMAPWAKVLYIRRSLDDTALSIFKNYFWETTSPHLCSLQDIGAYAAFFDQIMQLWQKTLPDFIHEVSYESLVRSPEAELKEALAFLSLEWEPACLEFHLAKKQTQTLSQNQVTQPLYDSSVGQAAALKDGLEPFFEAYRKAKTEGLES